MWTEQVLRLRFRVDLGVMATKGNSALPRSPELEPHYQILFSLIPRIPYFAGKPLFLCMGYSQHILSPADIEID